MLKVFSKISKTWIIALVVVVAAAFFGFKWWQGQKYALPKGIASGNGRVEAKLIDVSAKEPLRVKQILVDEGDLVRPGQVLVKLDTITLEAQLAEAVASVAAANERLAGVHASILRRKSEIELARIESERARKLLEQNAGSQRDYDVRKMYVETTQAALAEEQAKLETAKQDVVVAQANVATIQTRIDDATLTSPALGRVLYRLAEPGEVLGAGGKALTLVNLEDVYMEIFLPAVEAAAVKVGAEGRITMDYEPGVAARGVVSFVSPEAQFTPKEVETKSEREKLMFRVKIQVPKEAVERYIEQIKTGVRGVGYVKIDESAAWPDWPERRPMDVGKAGGAPAATPAAPESAAAAR
jgi:HlyD family secretion protein